MQHITLQIIHRHGTQLHRTTKQRKQHRQLCAIKEANVKCKNVKHEWTTLRLHGSACVMYKVGSHTPRILLYLHGTLHKPDAFFFFIFTNSLSKPNGSICRHCMIATLHQHLQATMQHDSLLTHFKGLLRTKRLSTKQKKQQISLFIHSAYPFQIRIPMFRQDSLFLFLLRVE